MAVEEDDGHGGRRRTNRARREHKGTPQGSPASPVLSNIYMRRFIVGWKVLGYARRFKAEIVNYADDLTMLGKAPATEMLTAVEALMKRLKLMVNTEKTHCCRVPEDSIEFLGYRIGRNYRRETGRAYIGTRPSAASVQSICRRVSELTTRRDGLLSSGVIVARLNRLLDGWANSFTLGQVRPAYAAIDRHARGGYVGGFVASIRCGREVQCASQTRDCSKTTVSRFFNRERRAFRGRRHDLVREPDAGDLHVRIDERRLETESWRGVRHRHRRKPPATATPYRLPLPRSRRLYSITTGGPSPGHSPERKAGAWYQMASIEIGAGEVAHIAPPLLVARAKTGSEGLQVVGRLVPTAATRRRTGTRNGYRILVELAPDDCRLGERARVRAGRRPRAGRAHFPMAAACCRKRPARDSTWLFRGMCCLPCRGNTYPCQPAEKHPLRHPIRRGTAIPAARGQPQGRRLPSKRTPGSGSRRHRGTGRRQARVKVEPAGIIVRASAAYVAGVKRPKIPRTGR